MCTSKKVPVNIFETDFTLLTVRPSLRSLHAERKREREREKERKKETHTYTYTH